MKEKIWLIVANPLVRAVLGRAIVLVLGALLGAALDAQLLDGQFVELLRLELSGLS